MVDFCFFSTGDPSSIFNSLHRHTGMQRTRLELTSTRASSTRSLNARAANNTSLFGKPQVPHCLICERRPENGGTSTHVGSSQPFARAMECIIQVNGEQGLETFRESGRRSSEVWASRTRGPRILVNAQLRLECGHWSLGDSSHEMPRDGNLFSL